MRILLPSLIAFLLYLIVERITLDRRLRRIPLRICVTGTRGKSSVTRILASILKESGRRVLAKTTGSQAMLLLPDGSQLDLRRRGVPSILEQKRLVKRAAGLRVDCLVSEIMSLQPECHFVEAQQILRPHVIAVTNVRRDHTEAMGGTEADIAATLSLTIGDGAVVFIPEAADQPCFAEKVERKQGTLIKVASGASSDLRDDRDPDWEFSDNLDLACTLARHLKIDNGTIRRGILQAQYDAGRLRIWAFQSQELNKSFLFVSAFAANDPESTFKILTRVKKRFPDSSHTIVGILNLRADRADRTAQWISALRKGGRMSFNKLYVTGAHSWIVSSRVPGVVALKGKSAVELTGSVLKQVPDKSILFGFGNWKGSGEILARYWSSIGRTYGT